MILPAHDLVIIGPLFIIGCLHRWIARHGSFWLVMSNLPSTALHEFSHWLVAKLLGSRVTGFSLVPVREGNQWRLGSVTAEPTVLSAVPMALAPMAWLVAVWFLLATRNAWTGGSLVKLIGVYVVAYICGMASVPSWQDLKVVIVHPLSILFWGSVLTASHFFIG